MNVAYVAALFLFCIRLCTGLRQRYAAPLLIPVITLYVLMTGANAPVLRAGIMALFVIISLSLAREPFIYQSLALAAMTIFSFNPQAIFTASFQLSFAATIGIVYIYPKIYAWCASWPRLLRGTLGSTISVSVAAQLAVAPILAYYFNTFSLIGLAANLIVVPLAGFITAGGLAMYLAHFISPALAAAAALPTDALLRAAMMVVALCAQLPHAMVPIAAPSMPCICVYYATLWLAFYNGFSARLRWAGTLAGALAVSLLCAFAYRTEGSLSITFLDVGAADAIHVRFPNGKNWLIDAGRPLENGFDTGERVLVPYLRSRGIRHIDAAVVTHPHYPHYAAMKAVLENFSVGEVLTNTDVSDEMEYREVFELLRDRHIAWREVWAGDEWQEGGVRVRVEGPVQLGSSVDDNCLVFMLSYGKERILLTSDMSAAEEQRIHDSGTPFTATVLQLPNHGNRPLSSSPRGRIKAGTMIISGAKNARYPAARATGAEGAIELHFSNQK